MAEKSWEERFPGHIPSYIKDSMTPEQFTEEVENGKLKGFHEMTEEERENMPFIRGVLDSAFKKDAKMEYVLLKSDEETNSQSVVRIYPPGPKQKEMLTYFLNWPVTVGGYAVPASMQRNEGVPEASMGVLVVQPHMPYAVYEEAKQNPLGKLRHFHLMAYLARQIYLDGKVKIAVVGPEKNGVDQFRQEFEALAKTDDDLSKCFDLHHIDIPLLPQGYSAPVVEKFYKDLGEKIQEIAESPENYDAICLVQGNEPVKSLARLNNPTIGLAVVRCPVPIISALGDNVTYLWLPQLSDYAVQSPQWLAHELLWVVQTVKQLENPEEEPSEKLNSYLDDRAADKPLDGEEAASASSKTPKPAVSGDASKFDDVTATKATAVAATTSDASKTTKTSTPEVSKAVPEEEQTTAIHAQEAEGRRRFWSRLIVGLLILIIALLVREYNK